MSIDAKLPAVSIPRCGSNQNCNKRANDFEKQCGFETRNESESVRIVWIFVDTHQRIRTRNESRPIKKAISFLSSRYSTFLCFVFFFFCFFLFWLTRQAAFSNGNTKSRVKMCSENSYARIRRFRFNVSFEFR